ncbi:DUF3817 domain-containing protein [Arthrobacter sp. Sa2BUA2]|uniref:DUF3817 domain-containing protein n=1 Tax=Arthrobacter pullicola TaxID=2762224 RepID=A0ABR8YGF4_9MICC|nr:DUF3817 domain-containing protein [Arthrobacter pullicola]MBD8043306.1 DUF3817 domain-containing protein [Arthrobacter pullicola]
MQPRTLFRALAFAEAVTWTLLIAAMVMKYGFGQDALMGPAGGTHGFIFLSYAASTVFVGVNQKWKFGTIVLGLVTAVIPYATIPFEKSMDKQGKLDGGWRLAPGGDQPSGFVEQVQAFILRRPVVSVVGVLIAIVGVFSVLLYLGPPVDFS